MMSADRKTAIVMTAGAVLVVIGAVMIVYWPTIFFSQLKKMMILTNQSMSYEMWRETPIPMYLEVYMFNITNVDEILGTPAGSREHVKLKVEQMGPYVFKETHIKVNIDWNDNSTVTFFNQRSWHFEPSMSSGSLSDEITSINPIVATVAYNVRHRSAAIHLAVDLAMRVFHEHMFITANVSSWMFDGIEDPFLDAARELPDIGFDIPYDKFGWFYTRNNSITFDGTFLMNTGATDFSQLGNIEKWKYSNRTTYRDECGEVRGSTGELWAPELGQEEVYIFASDICTYLILSKNDTVVVEGVEGVKYSSNSSIFDNGHNYPHMACYCDVVRDQDCLPSGALNVSLCQHGAPAFVSLPHFLHADPHYPSKIDGLEPKEEFNFHLALEMFTGMPLSVAAQLQINLLVRYVSGISLNNQLPEDDTLVPMFWFRQEMRTTPQYARMARSALNLRYYVPYAFYGLTVIGIVLLVAGIVILVKKLLVPTEPILVTSEHSPISEES